MNRNFIISFRDSARPRPNANGEAKSSWLDRPLSNWSCALGWLIALAIFVGFTTLFGGLTQLDALLSTYSSWFIAHGNFACAYPPGSSVLIALPGAAVHPHGGRSFVPLRRRSRGRVSDAGRARSAMSYVAGPDPSLVHATSALTPTLRFGYLGWLALMVGVVAVLRASRRGNTGWEPLTLILIACTPPVFMCLQYLFHPQDLLAMGLLLGAVALVLGATGGRWPES